MLASKLLGSGIISQAFGFVAIAFAASRTLPADFAVFAAVTAATAVIASANSLAAESRLPVVGQVLAESLSRAGFSAIVVFSVMCAAIGTVGASVGQVWGQVALLTAWCSFALGVQHLFVGIVLRTQRQELLAQSRLVQGISNATFIFIFVLMGIPGYLGLSLAWGLSLTLSDLILIPRMQGWAVGFRVASVSDFRKLFDQVRWQPVSNVLSDGVGQIPLLVLPVLGAPAVSGAWALANRFLMPIVNMAQLTLQPIYYGGAAALLRDGDIEGFQRNRSAWSQRLALGAIPVLGVCYLCLKWIIPLLGPEWRISTLVILPACILFPTALSWLPISQTLILGGHLRAQFVWTGAQFILSVVPFALVLADKLDALEALLAWSIVSAGGMLAHHVLQRRLPIIHHTSS